MLLFALGLMMLAAAAAKIPIEGICHMYLPEVKKSDVKICYKISIFVFQPNRHTSHLT